MAAPPRRCGSPPALPYELVEEILLRLPPDEPACLLRASFACKTSSRAVSCPAFRRRLHELHPTPPVLGFLHNWIWEHIPRFIPTTASSFSLAAPGCQSWRALDCRHGRALFLSEDQGSQELLVWEPITGGQRHVPVPALFESARVLRNSMCGSVKKMYPTAAVFCAADGCDHRDCHGGPFRLVFVFTIFGLAETDDDDEFDTWAFVFSSETGSWGQRISMYGELMKFRRYSSVLVGRSLLYFMSNDGLILEYDLARHGLTVFHPPDYDYNSRYAKRYNLLLAEDGGLGVCEALDPHLKLWSREVSDGTDALWVLSRVIYLGNLLPIGALVDADRRVQVLGFAEGANVIFVNTVAGLFTIELQSERVTKVCHDRGFCNLIPVVSFYTPVLRGEHQDLLPSIPSEEVGDEEGGEEEKTIDQAQQLFDKGFNAIKVGGFVNTYECISHDHNIRVPHCGEVALEGASVLNIYGRTLLPKAQEVIDRSGDVPKSAPNEESVNGTSSKDDAGNSTTSDSNVECAPPSEKDDSE